MKDLISYEEGSIANLDLAHTDNMKFVLMAFDEGTGLTPHRAPGNAILTALEGKAIIGYEGHRRQIELMVVALRNGAPMPIGGHAARNSVALVRALYDSAEQGRPIRIS